MNDDLHDDGLVHAHGWAKEPMRRDAAPQPDLPSGDLYDDGLVHAHAWASTDRGQQARLILPAE